MQKEVSKVVGSITFQNYTNTLNLRNNYVKAKKDTKKFFTILVFRLPASLLRNTETNVHSFPTVWLNVLFLLLGTIKSKCIYTACPNITSLKFASSCLYSVSLDPQIG